MTQVPQAETILQTFMTMFHEVESFRKGKKVEIDGQTLSISGIVALARYGADVKLVESAAVKGSVMKSYAVIQNKVNDGISIYGVSTGFGGSADARTDQTQLLGQALLQHHHVGILPTSNFDPTSGLSLTDPRGSIMPEAWVRSAMLVRINSLIRGHSGVRWELIETLKQVLSADLIPVVPLRASISASGDLTPLSYIAGLIAGNPAIKVHYGDRKAGGRSVGPSNEILRKYNLKPMLLNFKEPLGIMNGTAYSAGLGALVVYDAVNLAILAIVCTAMMTEALHGTRANYDPFIHNIARPHPGQVEVAKLIHNLLEKSHFAKLDEEDVDLKQDQYMLRQDRYPLRTAPQFLGPQVEDILAGFKAIVRECNSTTDNPLIDGNTGKVHHGGNFQAMSVTNAMEKVRLSLYSVGKLLFAQSTELFNPTMNNGLPPSLATTDPSLNYHTKGVDIANAAYVAELGYLANPVSTHIQSAEMHNQAVNSMALVSARETATSLEVLSMLTASVIYGLCQALDMRALQDEFSVALSQIVEEELCLLCSSLMSQNSSRVLKSKVIAIILRSLDTTTTMDAADRMRVMADATMPLLVAHFEKHSSPSSVSLIGEISQFTKNIATRAEKELGQLRAEYLTGKRGSAPAKPYLNKTRPVYEFVRETLKIKMHGLENHHNFEKGLGVEDKSIGENISIIFEAIRDGKLNKIVVGMLS